MIPRRIACSNECGGYSASKMALEGDDDVEGEEVHISVIFSVPGTRYAYVESPIWSDTVVYTLSHLGKGTVLVQ